MNLTILIASSLASWRLSSLLRYEDGPYHIFNRFRSLIHLTNVDELPINQQIVYSDKEFIHDGNIFAEIVECIWCLSIWLGVMISIILVIGKVITLPIAFIYSLAISALTILIHNNRRFIDGK